MAMFILKDKRVCILGGTGSLGKVLIRRLLEAEERPNQIIVFSRDEAKQYALNNELKSEKVSFQIGDIRDYHNLASVLREVDIVFNLAALKQVPNCEYFPFEAVKTNILGAQNIVQAIRENNLEVDSVIGISTDKACKPVNVMGMTKAIQERIFISGNLVCPRTRFLCVRYGNVLVSRGSVIPLFFSQIKKGGPVTITSSEMTRFLLTLDQAVNIIFSALEQGQKGEIFVPRIQSAKIQDIAETLIGNRPIRIETIGIRPGEKIHEILISEEEMNRAFQKDGFFIITPSLKEIGNSRKGIPYSYGKEYNSKDFAMEKARLTEFLEDNNLFVEQEIRLV